MDDLDKFHYDSITTNYYSEDLERVEDVDSEQDYEDGVSFNVLYSTFTC